MSIDSAVLLECLIGTLAWFDDSDRCTAKEPPENSVSENSKTLRMIQPGFSSLINISQFCASIFGTTLIETSSSEGGAEAAISLTYSGFDLISFFFSSSSFNLFTNSIFFLLRSSSSFDVIFSSPCT